MLGTITLSQPGNVRVHTYTAPDDGWCVNTHIVELATQLIVVDAQYTLPYAREAVTYAQTLNKPISRLYVTHYHPDHLLGAVEFKAPLYALAEVKAKIDAVGDRVAAEEHAKCGEIVAARAQRPSEMVSPGQEKIDGVVFDFIHLRRAETADALMIGMPGEGILITQDLVYHGVHVFVGEQAFDSWKLAIENISGLPYTRILPGHGAPGDCRLYAGMLHYLAVMRHEFAQSKDGTDLKNRLTAAFPGYGGILMLDHEMRFLFPLARPLE
jgi:glyoxylase-like metal-dependent hydrolase (beta-lactamase superfamily II)